MKYGFSIALMACIVPSCSLKPWGGKSSAALDPVSAADSQQAELAQTADQAADPMSEAFASIDMPMPDFVSMDPQKIMVGDVVLFQREEIETYPQNPAKFKVSGKSASATQAKVVAIEAPYVKVRMDGAQNDVYVKQTDIFGFSTEVLPGSNSVDSSLPLPGSEMPASDAAPSTLSEPSALLDGIVSKPALIDSLSTPASASPSASFSPSAHDALPPSSLDKQ